MDISELTIKLIFVLIPGALASLIFEKLTIHKPWNSFKFVSHSILFGVLAYLFTGLFIRFWNYLFDGNWNALDIMKNIASKEIPFVEIGNASVTGIILGLISSAIDHYKVINRIAIWLKISNKYGDINLYSHFLNSPNIGPVYFRDLKSNLTYHGLVELFSENEEIREILLRNVRVYYNEGKADEIMELYQLNAVYLSRSKDDVLIEIPKIIKEDGPKTDSTKTEASEGGVNQGLNEALS
jgi:hypothetical protein